MLCKIILTSINHYDFLFRLHLYSFGFSIYYMNLSNIIHKIFKFNLYNRNYYINPGFLFGILCGMFVEKTNTKKFFYTLFHI